MKKCSKCKHWKISKEFSKNSSRADNLGHQCKDCCKVYMQLYRHSEKGKLAISRGRFKQDKSINIKERRFISRIKCDYGMSLDRYNQMLETQNYLCAICKFPETEKDGWSNDRPKALTVDHCHLTGKIRGLLCAKCNRSLGGFKDSLAIINAASVYLTKTEESVYNEDTPIDSWRQERNPCKTHAKVEH